MNIEEKAKAYDEIITLIEKQNGIIPEDAILDSNEDGLIADTIRYKKQMKQKPIIDFNADDWYVSKVDGKIKKQGEQKPAWSEEDKKIVEHLINLYKVNLKVNHYPDLWK